MPSRLANIAVDAHDVRAVADFWCAALGWRGVEEEDGVVSIAGDDAGAPGIDVLPVADAKTVKNRIHLDLRADGTTQAEEVERLLALGARHADVGQAPDVSWVVLADVEGNEFCVLRGTVQEMAQA